MQLGVLLEGLPAHAGEAAGLEIRDIQADSRRVTPGTLFLALKGAHVDGHRFIPAAAAAGAVAVLAEDSSLVPAGVAVPVISCPGLPGILGPLGIRFFGDPSAAMLVLGVTGTNGKTSTTYFCKGILEQAGWKTGLIGTIENCIGEIREKAVNTTPDGLELQRLFRRMREAGVRAVVMEVSSHALALGRVAGVHFGIILFTNITEDHLDFHGDMESYLAAKLSFLDYLKKSGSVVKMVLVNREIQYRERVMAAVAASGLPCRTFGLEGGDYAARQAEADLEKTVFHFHGPQGEGAVSLAARGFFSIQNALGAMALALEAGVPLAAALAGVAAVRIPGRFEIVPGSGSFLVVVDYAHTDDALLNLIGSARKLNPQRIITVFGCGGDRDRRKRPLMAKAASSGSDIVFVTSDNPRSEDPQAIINDILPGIVDSGNERCRVLIRREEAIAAAIGEARPGDVVLIAGKGHEDYQIFADRTIHFSDQETAAAVLRGRA